jgi:ketosteroid isomerase-like protein
MITAQTEQEKNLTYVREAFEALHAGDVSGSDQLMEYFRFISLRSDGACRLDPISFAASGDKVFVQYHVNGANGGKAFESEGMMCLTIANGKTLEVSTYLEVCRRRA